MNIMPVHDGCFKFSRQRIDLFQYIKMLSRLVASRQSGSCKQPLKQHSTVCIKKRLVFEIQISHNYSDLIVLKYVELMIRDKNVSYSQKRSIGHVPLRENLLFYDSLNDSKQLYLSGKFNTL